MPLSASPHGPNTTATTIRENANTILPTGPGTGPAVPPGGPPTPTMPVSRTGRGERIQKSMAPTGPATGMPCGPSGPIPPTANGSGPGPESGTGRGNRLWRRRPHRVEVRGWVPLHKSNNRTFPPLGRLIFRQWHLSATGGRPWLGCPAWIFSPGLGVGDGGL